MNQIAPALTPEEWERCAAVIRLDAGSMFGASELIGVRVGLTPGHLSFMPTLDDAPARGNAVVFMAMGNAALPDNSPYKITQEDVATLHARANYEGDSPELRAIALKLAALLPPARKTNG